MIGYKVLVVKGLIERENGPDLKLMEPGCAMFRVSHVQCELAILWKLVIPRQVDVLQRICSHHFVYPFSILLQWPLPTRLFHLRRPVSSTTGAGCWHRRPLNHDKSVKPWPNSLPTTL